MADSPYHMSGLSAQSLREFQASNCKRQQKWNDTPNSHRVPCLKNSSGLKNSTKQPVGDPIESITYSRRESSHLTSNPLQASTHSIFYRDANTEGSSNPDKLEEIPRYSMRPYTLEHKNETQLQSSMYQPSLNTERVNARYSSLRKDDGSGDTQLMESEHSSLDKKQTQSHIASLDPQITELPYSALGHPSKRTPLRGSIESKRQIEHSSMTEIPSTEVHRLGCKRTAPLRSPEPSQNSQRIDSRISEYKAEFKEWKSLTTTLKPNRSSQQPFGLSATDMDGSKWKSHAKEVMEDSTKALASSAETRVAGNPSFPESSIVPPPSNFVWPGREDAMRAPLDSSHSNSETHDRYIAWPIPQPTLSSRKDSTHPFGLSATDMDGSKWKSHAKEVMEDSTKALASSAETRVAGNPSFPESSIVPPPSNFVWPGREDAMRAPLDSSHSNSETHDRYIAWPIPQPTLSSRKDSTHPFGLSATDMDGSKWKSHAKEVMEDSTKALASSAETRVAGNPSFPESSIVPPPSNFVWPGREDAMRAPLDSSHSNSETHDRYIAWPIPQPTLSSRKDSTHPFGLSATDMDGSKWKSHAKEVMEDSTKALASSAETRVAGNPSFPESSIVPPPSNFVWPGREDAMRAPLDSSHSNSETHDRYIAWPIPQPTLSSRKDSTHPFGLSATDMDGSKWKSHAKEVMEDSTKALASSAETRVAGNPSFPESSIVPPPSNFVWPGREDAMRAPLDSSHSNSETHDRYIAWPIPQPTLSSRKDSTHPFGLSATDMDGSKWKSHAKEVMEDSTKALASSAETRVAGNPSFPESSIVPPPSNFVWPGREDAMRAPLDSSHSNSETHDRYIAWPIPQPTLSSRKDSTHPFGLSATDMDGSKWKSHAKEVMEDSTKALASSAETRVAGNPSFPESSIVPPPSNFVWPGREDAMRAPLDSSHSNSETHDRYIAWPIPQPTLSSRKDSTHPFGLSATDMDGSKWKSHAKEVMEDSTKALASSAETRVAGNPSFPESSIVPPPSNFVWPGREDAMRAPLDSSHSNSETHDRYIAWPIPQPTLSSRKDSTHPFGLSATDMDGSKWKSHAKEVMEDSTKALASSAETRVAGNSSFPESSIVPPPSNFVWPGREARELDGKKGCTEHSDSYHEWLLSKTKSCIRSDSNPLTSSSTDTGSVTWKSETKDIMEEAVRNRRASNEKPIAGIATAPTFSIATNFELPNPGVQPASLDFKNCHTEYRDKFRRHDLSAKSNIVLPKPCEHIISDLSIGDVNSLHWKSETRDAMEQLKSTRNAGTESLPHSTVAPHSLREGANSVLCSQNGGVDICNNQTEYRDQFRDWKPTKASPLIPPVSSNPICESVDAVIPSSWKSESRFSMEQSARSMEEQTSVQDLPSSTDPVFSSPPYFAWSTQHYSDKGPCSEMERSTEYRDSYISWALAKATKSVKPDVRNPITHFPSDGSTKIYDQRGDTCTNSLLMEECYLVPRSLEAEFPSNSSLPMNYEVEEYDQIGPPGGTKDSPDFSRRPFKELPNKHQSSSSISTIPSAICQESEVEISENLVGKSNRHELSEEHTKKDIISMSSCHGVENNDEQKSEHLTQVASQDVLHTTSRDDMEASVIACDKCEVNGPQNQMSSPMRYKHYTPEIAKRRAVTPMLEKRHVDTVDSFIRRAKSAEKSIFSSKADRFGPKEDIGHQDARITSDVSHSHPSGPISVDVFIGGNVSIPHRTQSKTVSAATQTERKNYVLLEPRRLRNLMISTTHGGAIIFPRMHSDKVICTENQSGLIEEKTSEYDDYKQVNVKNKRTLF